MICAICCINGILLLSNLIVIKYCYVHLDSHMNKLIFAFVLLTVGCRNSPEYRTTPSGLQYKVFRSDNNGTRAVMMSTVKAVDVLRKTDSVYSHLPLYKQVMPPAPFVKDPFGEVLITGSLRQGDSVVIVDLEDKKIIYKINMVFLPHYAKVNVDSIINADKNIEIALMNKEQMQYAEQRLHRYFQRNNIQAERQGNIYVELIKRGAEPLAEKGKKAGIKFTSAYIHKDKIINSNKDTSFHLPPVHYFTVGDPDMFSFVNEVITQLGTGGHVKISIPAIVALGSRANSPTVDLTEDILFEMEVVSVK